MILLFIQAVLSVGLRGAHHYDLGLLSDGRQRIYVQVHHVLSDYSFVVFSLRDFLGVYYLLFYISMYDNVHIIVR